MRGAQAVLARVVLEARARSSTYRWTDAMPWAV